MSAHSSTRVARPAAKRIASARLRSRPSGWYAYPGSPANVSGAGDRRSGAGRRAAGSSHGPGAGSPWRRTSATNAAAASRPVTFCSMIAGTSASSTRRVRPIRIPGSRACRSRRSGCPATSAAKPAASSFAPITSGAWSIAQAAPGPHACVRIAFPSEISLSVTGPSGVRVARHAEPSRDKRNVGSPGPRRWIPSVRRRSTGRRARCGGRAVPSSGSLPPAWRRPFGQPRCAKSTVAGHSGHVG